MSSSSSCHFLCHFLPSLLALCYCQHGCSIYIATMIDAADCIHNHCCCSLSLLLYRRLCCHCPGGGGFVASWSSDASQMLSGDCGTTPWTGSGATLLDILASVLGTRIIPLKRQWLGPNGDGVRSVAITTQPERLLCYRSFKLFCGFFHYLPENFLLILRKGKFTRAFSLAYRCVSGVSGTSVMFCISSQYWRK